MVGAPSQRTFSRLVVALGLAAVCIMAAVSFWQRSTRMEHVPSTSLLSGSLLISVAASLSEVAEDAAAALTTQHPGLRIDLNVGSTNQLAQQIRLGAPVDVLLSADPDVVTALIGSGYVDANSRWELAGNSLALIIPATASAPAGFASLPSMSPESRLSMGNPETVPAGKYARALLTRIGIWDVLQQRLILGENVRQALDYVARGEAEAGIVYATDAATLGNLVRVVATEPLEKRIYEVVISRSAPNPAAAGAMLEFLRGPDAGAIFTRRGFLVD